MSNYVRKTITIRADQAQWVKEHPELNFSALVQRAVDEYLKAFDAKTD